MKTNKRKSRKNIMQKKHRRNQTQKPAKKQGKL